MRSGNAIKHASRVAVIAAALILACSSGLCLGQATLPATNPAPGPEVTVRIKSVDADAGTVTLRARLPNVPSPVVHIPPDMKILLRDHRTGGDVSRTASLGDVPEGVLADIHLAADQRTPTSMVIRGADGWGVIKEVDAEKGQVTARGELGLVVLKLLPDARIWRNRADITAPPLPLTLADLKPMTSVHFTYSVIEKGKVTALAESALDLRQARVISVDAKDRKITLDFKLIDEPYTAAFSVAQAAPIGSFDVKTDPLPLGQLTGRYIEAQLRPGDPTTIDEINIDIPVPEAIMHHATSHPSHGRPTSAPSSRPDNVPMTSQPAGE